MCEAVGNSVDTTRLASELRMVLGQLMRRLRVEHRFSLSQGAVLGRLDREGTRSIGDLAVAERVRPQSMTQTVSDLEADGLIARHPDPADGRRTLVELTEQGLQTLERDRRQREGWLARAIAEDLSAEEQQVLTQALALLRRLAEG
jgi:DNA-binding MarR family transcriptional regulator